MKKYFSMFLVITVLIFGMVGFARATTYTVTRLDNLGFSGWSNKANSINDNGQVVGTADGAENYYGTDVHAVIWENGAIKDLGAFDGIQGQGIRVEVYDINNSGQVVGLYQDGGLVKARSYPILWENGILIDLGNVFLKDGCGYGANAINDNGQVVGTAIIKDHPSVHAVLWDNEKITDLGALPNHYDHSEANAINNSGQVVGKSTSESAYEHAVLWENETITDLGTLGNFESCANDINDSGQVVGSSRADDYEIRAVIWQNGTITELGAIETLGYTTNFANAINNHGQIVGSSYRYWGGGSQEYFATLWQNGTAIDLNTLINDPSWTLSEATDINNKGEIVGYGYHSSIPGYSAFLLTPVENSDNPSRFLVLTDSSPVTVPSGSTFQIYGCAGVNKVTIEAGANAKLVNMPGNNTITIQSDSSLFTVSRSGATVTFQGSDGTVLQIPATASVQTIAFTDQTLTLNIYNNQVMLDEQVIKSFPVAIISLPLDDTITNTLGMTFKLIPAGTFIMGSPEDELGRYSNETQHQVTLAQGCYMQTTEVTQGQWEAVMGSNPSYFSSCGSDCPVENVSWDDAQEFINKLNLKGEGTYMLPTEAQWEYSARAGSTTAFANGNITEIGNDYDPNLNVMGWYGYNSDFKTHPVAQKSPNAWGLYDMHGNVFDWCQDWLGDYNSESVTDPEGPSTGSDRVARGGAWYSDALGCRSAVRSYAPPGFRHASLGLRLVLSPKTSL